MNYNDQDFIKVILQYHYTSQENIDKCLKIQNGLSEKIAIGEILREQECISQQHYNVALTLLRYKTGPVVKREPDPEEIKKQKRRDRHFAEIALKSGLITEEVLIEAVELQKKLEKEGERQNLAYIMKRKGLLSDSDVDYIESGGVPATQKFTQDQTNMLRQKFAERNQVVIPLEEGQIETSLIVIQGATPGKVYKLKKEESSIGRVRGADIRLDDSYISRIHCKIINDSNKWYVVDMMSTHGTFLNEKKFTGKTILQNEDEIRLGQTILCFRLIEN